MSTTYDTDDQRWDAVQRRDHSADGAFCYSVRTTGIYCRPSCPSRHALRKNVDFHASCAQAEAAGFRPCLRCRPDGPALGELHARAVEQACRLIDASEQEPSLDQLAEACGISRFHLHRIFKQHTGITPKAYAAARRAQKMQEELAAAPSVTDAIYAAGFNSSARFYAASNAVLGMEPTAWRAGGSGATIRFAVGESSLGSVLVAATAKGICAILIGDDPDQLARDLQDRFPKAELVGAEAGFELWVARVLEMVESPGLGLDLPLDVRGTAFQQRVWQALRAIPAGETVGYSKLAARLGAANMARAVAGACAANPVAIAIPCHRVVRNDGAISGYRWGVERKRALLERESVQAGNDPQKAEGKKSARLS
ncbi:MAG TPA: bifunctional DNA-binding transcriptional regulator/O6-methylguanine-DNA methyltransferase Ada [Telluria sp.]|nr:bifunctional DNA-binding transcriptional regulator/O6-methylguanine-DNA methyltransferase Ada [Telluria sp.]